MAKEKVNLQNQNTLQNSWSQVLLLIVIIFTGLSGFLLPINLKNQIIISAAMLVAIIGSFLYFFLSSSHKNKDLELLFDVVFGIAIFTVIFASGRYGMWYMYALFMLAISDAIIYRYRQLFLILAFFSSGLFVYYIYHHAALPTSSGWLIIVNIVALWATSHFVWFYAQDANASLVENFSAKDQLKQVKILDKKRSEFLHIASHQLKNPLGIVRFILLNFENDKTLSKNRKEQLHQAAFQVETAMAFLDDTTRILNMESTSKDITEENIEIEILVKEIITELEQLAKEKNLHVIKHIGGIIPPVVSDRMYLKIAISNIIDNAIKYSKQNSRIVINITEEKESVNVSVQDFGIGITRADQQRIYEKFFRGESAKELSPKGTGLGLYLVHTIFNKINAQISFESNLNKGSTFMISIPTKK